MGKKLTINPAFYIGDIVSRVIDEIPVKGIVNGLLLKPSGILYVVQFADRDLDNNFESQELFLWQF